MCVDISKSPPVVFNVVIQNLLKDYLLVIKYDIFSFETSFKNGPSQISLNIYS